MQALTCYVSRLSGREPEKGKTGPFGVDDFRGRYPHHRLTAAHRAHPLAQRTRRRVIGHVRWGSRYSGRGLDGGRAQPGSHHRRHCRHLLVHNHHPGYPAAVAATTSAKSTTTPKRDKEVSNLRDRRKNVWLLGVVVTVSLVAAACGSSKKSPTTTNTTVAPPTTPTTSSVKKGGILNYGADQEPTGFNDNTSKDNGTSVVHVMDRVWPSAFHYYPDFTVHYDKALLADDPQVTVADPQTVVMHINPKATWSDGVPINVD